MVEAALEALDRAHARSAALKVADLGTGSGALLLALLSELPMARGVGTDISREALGCARDNAVALGLARRASFRRLRLGAALKGPFDLVVANPPYVARHEIATLAPEVRVFDPRLALDGGPDGLAAYRAIAVGARELLSPDGILVLELGIGQLEAVEHLLACSRPRRHRGAALRSAWYCARACGQAVAMTVARLLAMIVCRPFDG